MKVVFREMFGIVARSMLAVGICMAVPWESAHGCVDADETKNDAPELLAIDPDAEAAMLELAGDGFQIQRTDHFVLAVDVVDESLRQLVARIERTYDSVHRFCRVQELPSVTPKAKLGVLFFHRQADFEAYARRVGFVPGGAQGFYSPQTNLAAFLDINEHPQMRNVDEQIKASETRIAGLLSSRPIDRSAVRAARNQQRRLRRHKERYVNLTNTLTVQHEVAHQVLFNAGVHNRGIRNPGWLVEGMACLFETPPSRSGAGIGAVNQGRLGDFRAAVGGGRASGRIGADELAVAFDSGAFLPLREMVGRPDLFQQASNAHRVDHYAQAWSLVHYLIRARPEQFPAYIHAIADREPGDRFDAAAEVALFEELFGKIDDDFEKRWAAYILDLSYKPSQAP